ncbi:hypothetical protein ACFPRL_20340 [Pseudoclavibacter helvolus]
MPAGALFHASTTFIVSSAAFKAPTTPFGTAIAAVMSASLSPNAGVPSPRVSLRDFEASKGTTRKPSMRAPTPASFLIRSRAARPSPPEDTDPDACAPVTSPVRPHSGRAGRARAAACAAPCPRHRRHLPRPRGPAGSEIDAPRGCSARSARTARTSSRPRSQQTPGHPRARCQALHP